MGAVALKTSALLFRGRFLPEEGLPTELLVPVRVEDPAFEFKRAIRVLLSKVLLVGAVVDLLLPLPIWLLELALVLPLSA
jgi:hypothetical protein